MYLSIFQTYDVEWVLDRLKKDIVHPIDYANKSLAFILSTDQRKEDFLSGMTSVFNISRCRCFIGKPAEEFIYDNCSCIEEDKILNFQAYTELLLDEEAEIVISYEEKLHYQEIVSSKH